MTSNAKLNAEVHSQLDAELNRDFHREYASELDSGRDDEIHDLSPGTFRFGAAILIGLAVLAIAMAW